MTASDNVLFWLFQSQLDRISPLLDDLPADAVGYRFVTPAFNALEHRPEFLSLASAVLSAKPELILKAQRATHPVFAAGFYGRHRRYPVGMLHNSSPAGDLRHGRHHP